MRFKLDENLGRTCAGLLTKAGHDVATVRGQNLCSSSDENLAKICGQEKRCLVTLDLDFGNPLRFSPNQYAGIVVLRLSTKSSYRDLSDCLKMLVRGLENREVAGRLWIVQRNSIREYEPEA